LSIVCVCIFSVGATYFPTLIVLPITPVNSCQALFYVKERFSILVVY
jgi:hypothetical protein